MPDKTLRTRAFDVARARGIANDAELARRMEVAQSILSRVRKRERRINQVFIAGAFRAFPDLTFEELFFWDPESAVARIRQTERDREGVA